MDSFTTLGDMVRPVQPCSQDAHNTSVGLDSFLPDRWAAERLPWLDGIGPLLPGGADKRPLVGDGWPEHPGLSIDKLQAAAPECICWNVGADPGRIGIDIDGPAAAAFCQGHGCEPYAADTWRIIRTGNTERLKLVFTVTPEQKAALVAGGKTVKPGGQELAVFAKPGTQIVVLGNHYTKESKHTENDDQYAWAGRSPADAQPLPPEWFALLTGVFCGERPLKPPTARQVSAPSSRKTNAYKSSGGWGNSSSQHPCPVCGRDHSGACSISSGTGKPAVWCCHGETKSAPDCSKAGEIVPGADGQQWAYVRTEEHDSFGERSLFVLHEVKQGRTAKTVNSSRPGAAAPTPPASVAGFIHQLPDGWVVDEETGVKRRSGLSVGHLADLLEAQPPHLRFNEMTMFVEVETTSGWVAMRDADMNSAYVLLSQKGWVIGIDPITKAICHVAQQQSFHPVRQYLLGLEQDTGTAAFDLDEVAPRFFRSPDPLHVAMVRKWLIGAVWRAMEPGCQMDYCLVLQSRHQGIGKTTSFKALASPDWFNSSAPDGDKDFLLNVHSCWIFEMGELESHTGKRSAGHMKNLITITTDNFRAPYGRNNEPHRRGSVFCGTVNEESFLRDETGNRRYWVVPITGTEPLDRDGLLAVRDGIWKAAVAAYRANELPMLTRAQEALSEIQNETFTYSDPWLEMLQGAVESNPRKWQMPFSTADVLEAAGLKQREQITRADGTRLAPLLRELGFDKGKHVTRTGNGQRIRLWSPVTNVTTPSQPQRGGCDTPEPLQRNDSQPLSQTSQPISSKKSKGGEQAAETAAADPTPVNMAKKVVTVVTPPANPLCRNGSAPSQPPQKGCDAVVTVVTPDSEPEWHQKARLLRDANPEMAYHTVALHLDIDYGAKVTGRQVREVLEQDDPWAA
jgi:hypothetical protein